MLTASPITNQPVGKTFSLAISLLGVGAILQLVLIGWAFIDRARFGVPPALSMAPPPASATLAHVPKVAPTVPNPLETTTLTEQPPALAATPAPAPAPAAAEVVVHNKPTPVIARPTPAPEPVNRFDELVLQGKQLRERGDMSMAITKFREAAALDGKSPVPLGELAITYDKMSLADKAAENWRKIIEMGDAGNIYYQAAVAQLKVSQVTAMRDVQKPAPAPETQQSPVDTTQAIDGVPSGATLGILQATAEEQHDNDSAKRFTLHIPIKARPKAHIDVRDLVIHVLFYDIVDGQNVVQTSANVNSRWAQPPADWADSDTEELAVEYQLPKLDARAAKRENRKYFGYIVRIYYKQQLQASTAEPERLAQQYPPPPTLPKENEK